MSCRFTYKNAMNEWFPRETILGEENFARAPSQMRKLREEERDDFSDKTEKLQKLIDKKQFLWLPTEDPIECRFVVLHV
jgi:hypothetical protein